MTILLTGGSKSGKSSLAESLCEKLRADGPLCYIATMKVVDREDMAVVQRHKRARQGKGFTVVERRTGFSSLRLPNDATVLFEDIPNALANELFEGGAPDSLADGLSHLAANVRHLLLITNEVDADGIVYDPLTAGYMLRLGALNAFCARMADTVCEVVSGLPIVLKGRLP